MMADLAQPPHGLAPATLKTLCDALSDASLVLDTAAVQISEIDQQLQEAGRLVCEEFQAISEAVDKSCPRVRDGVERIVIALQFEDRFSQRLSQVSRALQLASHLTAAVLSHTGMRATAPDVRGLLPVTLSLEPTAISPMELLRDAAAMTPSTDTAEVELF